ncbi:MAG: TRAP transporter large permease [Hyphomicrobiales bacterium]|nr:TRAP transporter large permease [Nitratireductor sp.]MCC2098809.1 TRAP transporter large permease [Hyphomicrobiales bacterium]
MISMGTAFLGFALMLGLMALGIHVAAAMFLIGTLGAIVFLSPATLMSFGTVNWGIVNDSILTAIPLYVLLGEIMLRSGMAERMYRSISSWITFLPGGLLHTNIAASAMFAAVSGSSLATAATIGTVAIPTLDDRGYNARMTLGSIAAGSTLGILIPPSIGMIIYGAITNTSIGGLFMAGIVPGLLLTAIFMSLIAIASMIRPDICGQREEAPPLAEKLRGLVHLIGPAGIILVIICSIYLGWATPTESAAIGVVAALLFSAASRRLTFGMLHEAFKSTVRVSGMILLLVVSAFFLNFVISILGVTQTVTQFVLGIEATPTQTILFLVIFYLVLGCFMETMSMMIATVPVVVPVVVSMGFDPIWFGVVLVLLMEMALITPPVGLNLYVVQSVRKSGPIQDTILGAVPFLLAMLFCVILLIIFPQIALWVPNNMAGH